MFASPKDQYSAAYIQFDYASHRSFRENENRFVQHPALVRGRPFEVSITAQCHRPRQFRVADKFHPGTLKCRIAQQMVRMDMCINDVADRQIGHLANRTVQSLPLGDATTGIDHGYAALTDHKTDVRDLLTFKYDGSMPGPNVNTGSYLHDLSRFRAE